MLIDEFSEVLANIGWLIGFLVICRWLQLVSWWVANGWSSWLTWQMMETMVNRWLVLSSWRKWTCRVPAWRPDVGWTCVRTGPRQSRRKTPSPRPATRHRCRFWGHVMMDLWLVVGGWWRLMMTGWWQFKMSDDQPISGYTQYIKEFRFNGNESKHNILFVFRIVFCQTCWNMLSWKLGKSLKLSLQILISAKYPRLG